MQTLLGTASSPKLSSSRSLPLQRPAKAPALLTLKKTPALLARCQLAESGSGTSGGKDELRIGSPIIVVEAPPMLKTATAMTSLRINHGLVKQGDVGRIIARKPKDVWAVRLAMGTYLIDGKYFKPLDIVDE